MDSGSSQEKLYVCPAPRPHFSFLVTPSFPHLPPLCLSPLSILLAPSGSVRHNCVSWEIISSWPCSRSSDIFHLSSIFYPLPFFYRPLPPFHGHLSSSPQNHFHLSSHTNVLTEFLLVRKKKKKRKRKKVRGWDKIAFSIRVNSEKIEKYRYASEVKMRKEVERKINTFMCTHTTRCVFYGWALLTKQPFTSIQ